jgi:hypothetical protein
MGVRSVKNYSTCVIGSNGKCFNINISSIIRDLIFIVFYWSFMVLSVP